MCRRAFALAHSHSPTHVKMVKREMESGLNCTKPRRVSAEGLQPEASTRTKSSAASSWLHAHVKRFGMHMPHSGRIMLCDPTIQQLHSKCESECKQGDNVGRQHFGRVWKRQAEENNWELRNRSSDFATCATCARCEADLCMKLTHCDRTLVKDRWADHLKLQRACRERCWHHRHNSEMTAASLMEQQRDANETESSHSCLSIILDTMDQAKCFLPKAKNRH